MNKKERLLITGAGGFLGKGLVRALEKRYALRLVDIRDFDTGHEKYIGDVASPEFCNGALKDCDLLLVAHMSPRPCDTPFGPFNANVTGTANLLYAAVLNKIRRVGVVSSVDAVRGEVICNGRAHDPALRPSAVDIYSATKACQEIVAEAFHREFGLSVAVLRIGYVVDCAGLVNKYGIAVAKPEGGMIDPYDCGMAVGQVFAFPELTYRVWYLYSFADRQTSEGFAARRELCWQPRYMEQPTTMEVCVQ